MSYFQLFRGMPSLQRRFAVIIFSFLLVFLIYMILTTSNSLDPSHSRSSRDSSSKSKIMNSLRGTDGGSPLLKTSEGSGLQPRLSTPSNLGRDNEVLPPDGENLKVSKKGEKIEHTTLQSEHIS